MKYKKLALDALESHKNAKYMKTLYCSSDILFGLLDELEDDEVEASSLGVQWVAPNGKKYWFKRVLVDNYCSLKGIG